MPGESSIFRILFEFTFRKDGSCRIDNSGIFENRRAYPGLQSTPGNQVDSAPGDSFQFLGKGFEFDQTDACSRLELNHHVDVAFRAHFAADCGPEQREFFDTVTAAHFRQRRAIDMHLAELGSQVHGLSFIMPQQATRVVVIDPATSFTVQAPAALLCANSRRRCDRHVENRAWSQKDAVATTYVIGAGASRHAKYPLASEMGQGLIQFMLGMDQHPYAPNRFERTTF